MKKKYATSLPFRCRMFPVILLLTAVFVFSSCGPRQDKSVTDWINLTIKFKPNSTAVIREAVMNTIEQILVDTVRQMREGNFKDFDPSFVRTKDPFKDTLIYTISVGLRGDFGERQSPPPITAATAPASCLCKTDCRICRLLFSESVKPQPELPLLPFDLYIDSLHSGLYDKINSGQKPGN